MSTHSADDQHLHRALELARAGIGLASPNPYVGAVIADAHGNIVGSGTYTSAGVKHAEILAREAALGNALHQHGTACSSGTDASLHRCAHRRWNPSRGGFDARSESEGQRARIQATALGWD